jgi:phage portal protein BeeE
LEDVIFIKSFNPSSNIHEEFRGLSPVRVLARTLARIRAAEDVTVAQLQNGGGKDIVYDKTPDTDTAILGQQRDSYSRFVRNRDNTGAPYFAAGEMGVISLGSKLTELEITTLAELDFDHICSAFGVSSIWFNSKSASTESNVENMIAEAYTNTMIPMVQRVEGALNKGLQLGTALAEIKTKGVIKCDTSEIKALQEDQTELVNALAAAWWLTPNEKRTAQMYDQAEDELMDKFLVPSNLVPIDDLLMPEPLDNTAKDYQKGRAAVVPIKTGTNG